jgi:hypothetical protein
MALIVYQRPQVMYSLDFSSECNEFNSKHKAVELVSLAVSDVVGGCTVIDCAGWWADVERANHADYKDVEKGVENCVQLQVKAEVEKEEILEHTIIEAFIEVDKLYPELGIDWVCGHKVTKEGNIISFNFSVEENKKTHNS